MGVPDTIVITVTMQKFCTHPVRIAVTHISHAVHSVRIFASVKVANTI